MDFPNNCVRGVKNKDSLTEEGFLSSSLFQFHNTHFGNDEWNEESINWEDDDSVIEFTLNQKKDGDFQFKAGVAILPRKKIDEISNRYGMKELKLLSYERDTIKKGENPYHGNILLRASITKPTKRLIQAALAMASLFIARSNT